MINTLAHAFEGWIYFLISIVVLFLAVKALIAGVVWALSDEPAAVKFRKSKFFIPAVALLVIVLGLIVWRSVVR